MGRERAQLMAVEGDGAGVGLEDAAHAVEERRLPGAVGPDEPHDLSGVHPQGGVVEGRHPAEVDADVLDLQKAGLGPPHDCATRSISLASGRAW